MPDIHMCEPTKRVRSGQYKIILTTCEEPVIVRIPKPSRAALCLSLFLTSHTVHSESDLHRLAMCNAIKILKNQKVHLSA